ncbi:MAG: esterase/lipase family protein [Limisphaerales bacterium]
MPRNPLILIHGYSDRGESFKDWKRLLVARGYPAKLIHVVTYESLTNEVTIKDIAEGFDRALRLKAGLNADEDFDAVVHSTGMLVIRAWLTTYPARRGRLKRLIGLAPATFGSPLAHTGRSTLGALFKGRKELGADFLEAGDLVLDGLELGSRFTWDLAHADLIGKEGRKPVYGSSADTPYVFVFCGNKAYGGLRQLVNQPGTDGTVRFAGAALNTRKITANLTLPPNGDGQVSRHRLEPWTNINMPVYLVEGLNHGTIVSDPSLELVGLVWEALAVESQEAFDHWTDAAAKKTRAAREGTARFQQFIIRAVDERGDGIADYNVQLLTSDSRGRSVEVPKFDLDVHVYRADPSLRCFHVNLDRLKPERLQSLKLQVIATARSRFVGYLGYDSVPVMAGASVPSLQEVTIDITDMLKMTNFEFFKEFTTTLVELRLNREPLPHDALNGVCQFIEA